MELVDNFVQFSVTLLGFCLSGMRYLKGRKQAYFLLTCFYGCFALGSLYWTLYLFCSQKRRRFFMYRSLAGWQALFFFLFCNTPFPLRRKEALCAEGRGLPS